MKVKRQPLSPIDGDEKIERKASVSEGKIKWRLLRE